MNTDDRNNLLSRGRALRLARESIGLPQLTEWSMSYNTSDLELAAGYLKIGLTALQNELARRQDRLSKQMMLDLSIQRERVVSSFTNPEEALCTHSLRLGVCPDC